MAGGAAIRSRLDSVIFVILLIIPAIGAIVFGAVDQITWTLFFAVWAVLIVLWLIDAWQRGALLLNPSTLLLPLFGLLLIGGLQLILPGRAGSIDPSATYFFELRLIVLTTFFAGYLTFIDNEARLSKAVNFIVIFGASMAFYGILQRLASPDGIYGLRETPQSIPFGPFVNQHHFAAFMEMTGGLTLGLLFGKHASRDRRVLLGTAVIIMGAAVAFTSSRGGMLAFTAVLCFVLLFTLVSRASDSATSRGGYLGIAAAGLGLLMVVFGLVLFLGGNDPLLRSAGFSDLPNGDLSNGRFSFWRGAVEIFFRHPILGTGLDTFEFAFTSVDTWPGIFRVERAHNDYLQTLTDSGIAGFACVVAFIVLLFRQGVRAVRNSYEYRRDAAVGALAGCFGILVHSFFDFPLRTYSNAFFFVLLAAIATVPIAEEQRRRRKHHG